MVLAFPTPSSYSYTRRYGPHHYTQRAADLSNRIERGSKHASEMSRLMRQRAAGGRIVDVATRNSKRGAPSTRRRQPTSNY